MAEDRPGITPADDPYEFDWPDDAKEARAAEREATAQKAAVKPAPVLLTAIVVGIGMVLAFILPIAVVSGAIGFLIAVAAPIVIGGLLFALLPAVLLERVSLGWRRGFPEIAFVALGFVVGMGWTWLALTAFQEFLFENAASMEVVRVRASVFMGTAVAAGFFSAHAFARPLSTRPRFVYSVGIIIALLTVLSLVANFTFGK